MRLRDYYKQKCDKVNFRMYRNKTVDMIRQSKTELFSYCSKQKPV